MTTRALLILAGVLAIALVLSLTGNAWQAEQYLGERDQRLQAVAQRDQATGAARACSAGVERLQTAAADRARAAASALAAAQAKARSHQGRAQQILASPPAVPGDACASAGGAIDAWLQGRARK